MAQPAVAELNCTLQGIRRLILLPYSDLLALTVLGLQEGSATTVMADWEPLRNSSFHARCYTVART